MPFDNTQIETDVLLTRLMRVRELIAQGWVKGIPEYRSPEGTTSYCLEGAALQAVVQGVVQTDSYWSWRGPGHPDLEAVRRALRDHLQGAWHYAPLAAFNDWPCTTHADVLALCDRAIEGRRAELAALV